MTAIDPERTFNEQVERRRRTAKASSHSLTASRSNDLLGGA
ncbi:MAG: hypothetical protein V3T43_02325 [Nitrosomonadaceae bacterium]